MLWSARDEFETSRISDNWWMRCLASADIGLAKASKVVIRGDLEGFASSMEVGRDKCSLLGASACHQGKYCASTRDGTTDLWTPTTPWVRSTNDVGRSCNDSNSAGRGMTLEMQRQQADRSQTIEPENGELVLKIGRCALTFAPSILTKCRNRHEAGSKGTSDLRSPLKQAFTNRC